MCVLPPQRVVLSLLVGAYGSQKLKVDNEREGQAAEKNTLIHLRKDPG
jgi:hypothetical protein